ncbi:MAG: DUF99 family protein [Candidatus Bathyarchaeota archaeon]|nr:DUF99 family protein [Candidatus Bathyarchaeota archaeon]
MADKKFRVIKPEIRILGVDDGVFVPHQKGYALVVGVVFRGGQWLDGVLHTRVEVDGLDATDKIASMILSSPHHKQLRAIFLNGMTFAGFNIVNIKRLNMETRLPVVTVTREKPDLNDIYDALKNLPDSEKRWQIIKSTGEPFEVLANNKKEKIYMQISGIGKEDAIKILKLTSTRSNIPEPLRVAHLIASGITTT